MTGQAIVELTAQRIALELSFKREELGLQLSKVFQMPQRFLVVAH